MIIEAKTRIALGGRPLRRLIGQLQTATAQKNHLKTLVITEHGWEVGTLTRVAKRFDQKANDTLGDVLFLQSQIELIQTLRLIFQDAILAGVL